MRKILEAIVVGILFGLLTHIAAKHLPDNLKFLVETKIIWLLPAFLVSFNMPLRRRQSDSIIIAIVTLLATGATYYLSAMVKNQEAFVFTDEMAKMSALGVVLGAATGIAAYLGHSATNQFIRYGSISVLPAIYTGDGINQILQTIEHFEFTPEIGTKIIGGLLFYLLISGPNRFKAKSLISFATLIAIAALIYLYMV